MKGNMKLTNLETAALISAMTGLPFIEAAELVSKAVCIEILLPLPPAKPDAAPDADSFAA